MLVERIIFFREINLESIQQNLKVVIGIVGFGFIRCCGNGFNLKGHSQDTKFTLLYSSLEFAFAHSE